MYVFLNFCLDHLSRYVSDIIVAPINKEYTVFVRYIQLIQRPMSDQLALFTLKKRSKRIGDISENQTKILSLQNSVPSVRFRACAHGLVRQRALLAWAIPIFAA